MVLEVTTVMARARPRLRARAVRLGRKPRLSIAASTAVRVSGRTRGDSFSTRETVWYDTPAAAATSRMLGAAAPRAAVRGARRGVGVTITS
ncbi:hypothetical protein GCM10023334_096250 [Nonomuraea thailandensis]